jgi:membrane glycosyltransferase
MLKTTGKCKLTPIKVLLPLNVTLFTFDSLIGKSVVVLFMVNFFSIVGAFWSHSVGSGNILIMKTHLVSSLPNNNK